MRRFFGACKTKSVIAGALVAAVLLVVAQLPLLPTASANEGQLPPPAAGNVNCDSSVNVIDALFIIQLEVQLRTPVVSCPLPEPATQILAGAGDVTGDGAVNVVDALFIAQCEVGVPNSSCPPSPISSLEAEWATTRQTVIDEILANGWGRQGSTVVGPGDMFIDLASCPTDWDDMAGIEDGVVTVGHTTAASGIFTGYGNFGLGMQMYFDYVNERGGVGPLGLEIDLEIRDDGYNGVETVAQVEDLLANVDPLSIVNLGTPPMFAVREILNDACVPQPLAITQHPAPGDPANYPFTTGSLMSYSTEAKLWLEWIEQNLESGVEVAALVSDNDLGYAYESAFERFAIESDAIESITFVRHDPSAPTLQNEMTTLADSSPDVVILMTSGNPCYLALEQAGDLDLSASTKAAFVPSACSDVGTYLLPAGGAGNGWLAMLGGQRTTTSAADAADPFVSWVSSELTARGGDPTNEFFGAGFGFYGWTHVEALRVAAELPGGVTRSNFMVALRSLELNHPMMVPGIAVSMNGLADAHLIEGSDVARYDAETQSWVREGVIDVNGQTPVCSWAAATGCSD